MAGRFDVAARLAEGRPAAEHTQSYVWACHLLGYQHPDLTAHGSQVSDWYGSEEGLDLHTLDSDCAQLGAAVSAIEEALRIQRAQIAELAAAWTGSGADSAVQFLQRHCDTGNAVAAGVRAAAEGCGALRDDLWQMIDSKVATAVAIDDRGLAQRPAWLAAAQTVTTGVGDRPAADEMVNHQVKPYVDNDIRTDWLTGMRSTLASVAASYDALTDRLSTAASFELSGDLGSGCLVLSGEPVQLSTSTVAAPVMPAAAVSAPDGAPAVSPESAPGVPPLAGAMPSVPEDIVSAASLDPVPPTTATPPTLPISGLGGLPAAPTMSDLGAPLGTATGMPVGAGSSGDLGNLGGLGGLSSLGSLVGRIADAISGLVGSLTDGLADPSGIDNSPFDGPPDTDDLVDDKDADDRPDEEADERPDQEEADNEEADAGEDAASGSAADSPPEDVAEDPTAQEVTTPPVDGPPPAAPPPTGEPSPPTGEPPPAPPAPPDPQSGGSTPCEIAADELPQAGQ
ncbi:MAG TPA: hypothetical protein VEF72_10290 [Mycobacterium sp.]|nr:hypothetical protein [Mycobacterium sp.]